MVTEPTEALERILAEEEYGAQLTVLTGPDAGAVAVLDAGGEVLAGSVPESIQEPLVADALTLMDREMPLTVSYGEVDVFVEPLVPRPRLVIFGAVHIAQALAQHASLLGYHVTVSDARSAFTTEERFPDVDHLAVGWPDQVIDQIVLDRRTSIVVLSHDARFENPLWPLILESDVRYIGAMGSRRTAERRRERLLEAGFDASAVDRIHGPIGLDIGAESPGEVAVAILAEMISEHRRPHEPLELKGEVRPLVPAHRAG
ncbi:MAG TPA: XdhC family protein [Acidimicrobiia bacterium]|nr:XdhC family protein [Acidimicrobiia bacterium]